MKKLFKPIYDESTFVYIIYPNVEINRYMINCIGVIVDTFTNEYVKHIYNTNNGYYQVSLKYAPSPILVHRLVATMFCYKRNCEYDVVNHIDGVKTNNHYSNLEWVTPGINRYHAIQNGLVLIRGENNGNSRLTEKQVRRICELLEKQIRYSDILIDVGLEVCDKNLDIITKIRTKHIWKEVSDQYNIPEKEFRSKQIKYTTEQIHCVCKYIEEGYNNREIANLMNIDISDDKSYDKYLKFVLRIRRRQSYTEINNGYNW